MEVKMIEEKAYDRMKSPFEEFVRDITELCQVPEINKQGLDNEDVCRLLNNSKRTLKYYREYGKLEFSRVGNKCYYKISDVQELIS